MHKYKLASFTRGSVLAVLSSVALDHFPFPVVSLDGEGNRQDVVAGLDDLEDPPDAVPLLLGRFSRLQIVHEFVLHNRRPAVEETLDHPKEVWVIVFLSHSFAIAADPQERRGGGQSGVRAHRGQCAAGGCACHELSQIPIHGSELKQTNLQSLKRKTKKTDSLREYIR